MIPKRLLIKGKEFKFCYGPMSGGILFDGWWCCYFIGEEMADNDSVGNDGEGYIPFVTDGNSRYYLVSAEPTKEESFETLERKVKNAVLFREGFVKCVDNEYVELSDLQDGI